MKRYFTTRKLAFYAFSCSLVLVFYYIISINLIAFDVSSFHNDAQPHLVTNPQKERDYIVELQFDSVLFLIGCFESQWESFNWSILANGANSNQSAFWVLPKMSENKQTNMLKGCVTFCQARHLSVVALNTELCACFESQDVMLVVLPSYSKSSTCNISVNITMKNTRGRKNKKLIAGMNDTLAVYKQLVRIPPTAGFSGCFRKSPVVKWKENLQFNFGFLSVDFCVNHCERNGFMLAGINNPSSCGCADISATVHLHNGVDVSNCMLVCVDKQSCGGPGYLSIYRTKNTRQICYSVSTSSAYQSVNPALTPATLLSLKGSGSAWISTLVRSSIGLDDRTKESITKFNQQILITNHELDSFETLDSETKVVVLLRNPYATFLSKFRRKIETENEMDTHHTYLDSQLLRSYGWKSFMDETFPTWGDQYRFWVSNVNRNNSMVVYYEDFLVNPVGQISRLLNFLNLKIETNRILCTLENYVRKYKSELSAFLPYTKNDTFRIQSSIDVISYELNSRNFMPMPSYTFENRTSKLEPIDHPKYRGYYDNQKKDL